MIFQNRNLNVSAWNIAGFKTKCGSATLSKFGFTDFKALLKDDIFCLLETHAVQDDTLVLEGYTPYMINRPKRTKRGQNSGGLAIFVRNEIRNSVELIKCKSKEYTWLRIKKAECQNGNDIYICFVYDNPQNSTFTAEEDVLVQIEKDLCVYQKKGNCIVMGDLNDYTNSTENDFIVHDESNDRTDEIPLPQDYRNDKEFEKRTNRDNIPINLRGREILDLCIGSGLRILNGRKLGDLNGNYTCFNDRAQNPSVIDYALVHVDLYDQINMFKVSEFTPFLTIVR